MLEEQHLILENSNRELKKSEPENPNWPYTGFMCL